MLFLRSVVAAPFAREVVSRCARAFLSIAALAVTFVATLTAQSPFTPGNVLVVRVGDGAAALASAATPVFLEEWAATGGASPVQTINLTTLGANVITSSGTATSEGFLTTSADGRYFLYAGYNAAVGTATVTTSASAAVNRVIARIARNASSNTSTLLTDAISGGNPRSAVSDDGTQFWIAGSTGGIRYASSLGATTSTQLSTAPTNNRVLGIPYVLRAPKQLYASQASSPFFGVSSVGSGLPTASGQTVTLLPGFPTVTGPSSYDFFVADAATIYVADDRTTAAGGGLQKWTFNGTTWSLAYTLNSGLTTGLRGVTGQALSSPRVLYATSADTASKLVRVVDNGAGAASPFTTLTTAPTNRAFRGVRFIAPEAPTIATQPTAVAACAGGSATFTVAATGTGLQYSWYRNGTQLGVGAPFEQATLSLSSLTSADLGTYSCLVYNSGGQVFSNSVALTINDGAAVATNPTPVTVCAGLPASFSVSATGTAPLSYQWRKGGIAIPGQTSNTLSIAAAVAGDAGSYDCVVTNACATVTSAAATLTVDELVAITAQPSDVQTCEGTSATFSVTATGTAPLSYQWRKNGSPIGGASASSYSIASVAATDAGAYDCVVTNGCGIQSSAFATLTVDELVAITAQPAGLSVLVGNQASFAVIATGAAPRTYQWRKNGLPISGATASTLSLAAATLADIGTYDVVVSNGCGFVVSEGAALTVTEVVELDVQCYGVSSGQLNTASGDFVAGNGNDIVVADAATGTVQLLVNNGNGQFTSSLTLNTGAGPRGLALADFDGDGYLDFAVACALGGSVQVFYGDGAGAFSSPVSIVATAPVAIAAVRVLGRTLPDLAIADGSALRLASNDANTIANARAFAATSLLAAGSMFNTVAAADVVGSAAAEIVATDATTGLIHVIDGATLLPALSPLAGVAGAAALALADLNGDARADLAVAGTTGVTLLRTPFLAPVVVDPQAAVSITTGRFDQNANADIAYVTAAGQTIVLHDPQAAVQASMFQALPSPTASASVSGAAHNLTGSYSGPLADTDELVIARTSGDVCVVRLRAPAGVSPISGTGCGASSPSMTVNGLPTLGNATFGAAISGATPSTIAALAYQVNAPTGTPLTIGNLGLCTHAFDLNQDLPVLVVILDAAGQGSLSLSIPPVAYFAGFEFPMQWAVLDGGDPTTGLTLSQAVMFRIGEY